MLRCYTIDTKEIHSIQESKSILEIDILDLYLWWILTHHKGKNSHSSLSLDIIVEFQS